MAVTQGNLTVLPMSFAMALMMSLPAGALPVAKLTTVGAGAGTMAEISGSRTAQAGHPARLIVVSCNAASENWKGAACRALKAGLERRSAGRQTEVLAKGDEAEGKAYLAVDIEWLRIEPTFLLARLVWQLDGAARQTGPEIEVSVNDRDVTESDAVHLAETLVKMTPLPF
ncbi:hypothetical protein [Stappia sp.]|uniref:hypothetical protein n=1 Tax=Stappia sp. TaxID=1870903 RepID=UPI003A9926E7